MTDEPYNPLDKLSLARSIETKLLERPAEPLAAISGVVGAGVYAIYYVGKFAAYKRLADASRGGEFDLPIYVGKAIPKGGRKGGLTKDASVGRSLLERLGQHRESIAQAKNLDLKDFFVRHLVVEDIWIPLGENMLIETFKPVWNRAIDGFGNKDPGRRRATQHKSPWDVLHPGRDFAVKLADGPLTQDFLRKRIADYFAGRPLDPLPKMIENEQEEEKIISEQLDAIDE